MIDQIAETIDAITAQALTPARIEIGEKQARALADELNAGWYLQRRLGFTWDNTAPKPIAWERLINGRSWLFDVPIHGVESPDYLLVVAGEP